MNVQYTAKIDSIFTSTLALIKENGFHGSPMSQIAKSANVAIGTIYHYFPSKDSLILALFQHCKQEMYKRIFNENDEEIPYKEQFYLVFKRFCEFHINETEISSFLEQFYNSPYNAMIRQLETECNLYENKVLQFLLNGMKSGYIKTLDTRILTSAYLGAAVSYSRTVTYGDVKFEQQQIESLVEIIWNGVKKD